MSIELIPAIVAGLVGGLVMFLMRLVMQAMGVDLKMDMALLWGTMFRVHGTAGRILGFVMHMIVSALIALIYAWGFDLLGITENVWLWGLVGGVIHWVIAGLFMAVIPAMHPEIPESRRAPGLFVKNFGSPDVPVFLVGHIIYGVLVGAVYAYLHSVGGGIPS